MAGAYETVQAGEAVLAYRRGTQTVVALNLGGEPATVAVTGEILLSTELDGREGEPTDGELALRPGEGAIVRT